MPVGRVRLWVIGAACYACGIGGCIAFERLDGPGDRASGGLRAIVLAPVFAVGWVLLAAPVIRRSYAPGEPSRKELLGCLLAVAGAFVSFVAVVSLLGS